MHKNEIFFISGHIDLTIDEFNMYYKLYIDNALKNNCSFVIGDAKGADKLAQQYLVGKTNNVTVYHMFTSPRNNVGNFKTIGGFKSDDERDSQMTKDSTKDIAWVRPGREESGTAKNIKRRFEYL